HARSLPPGHTAERCWSNRHGRREHHDNGLRRGVHPMQRFTKMLLALGLTGVLAACGGAPGSADWAGTVRDSAGIRIVENPAVGLWRRGEEWRVVEELRIGVTEGEPEYMFGNITGMAADRDGRIYVLDQQAQEVRIFDAQGTFLRK